MIVVLMTVRTSLNAQLAGQTYYSVSTDGGITTYLSSSTGNRFADYPFSIS